jgi:hypothetical protein
MYCFFIGINCCVLGALIFIFLLKLKSLQIIDHASFIFFKTIPDYDWVFFFFFFFLQINLYLGALFH